MCHSVSVPSAIRRPRYKGMLLTLTIVLLGTLMADARDELIEIEVDGMLRSAIVSRPDQLDAAARLPLVLAFHGSAWNGRLMQTTTQFAARIDQEHLIVVYPHGSGPTNILSWNAEYCCSFALERDIDDIRFVDRLLATLHERYPIDPDRVYATGFSNGGMLTYRLAIERPEVFAAVAIVSGAMYPSQTMSEVPVPLLLIHGTHDNVIPYEGGWGTLRTLSGRTEPAVSASEAADFWVRNNSCQASSAILTHERNARILTYSSCANDAEVVFITLLEGTHAWPTITSSSDTFLLTDEAADLFTGLFDASTGDALPWDVFESGIDATRTIWEFFQRH